MFVSMLWFAFVECIWNKSKVAGYRLEACRYDGISVLGFVSMLWFAFVEWIWGLCRCCGLLSLNAFGIKAKVTGLLNTSLCLTLRVVQGTFKFDPVELIPARGMPV